MKQLAIPKINPFLEGVITPVQPIKERLVPLNFVREDCLFVLPYYHMHAIKGAEQTVFIREMAMNLLVLAASKLPKGYKLVIWDGWRSPSTCLSEHGTGGAVHVTMMDENGDMVEMGTELAEVSEITSLRYFEEKMESGDTLSEAEELALRNRRVLYEAMTNVGFTNTGTTWYHFDFGNESWARIKGKQAFYGSITL